jgi:ComEC/Rec2-related protein
VKEYNFFRLIMKAPLLVSALSRLFPGWVHWGHLRAFSGAAAVAAGISFSECLQVSVFTVPGKLYPVFFAFTILAGVTGVISRKKRISLIAFFVAGMAVFLLHTARQVSGDEALRKLGSMKVTLSGDLISVPAPRRDRFVWLLKLNGINGRCVSPLCGRTFLCESSLLPAESGSLIANGYFTLGRERKNRYDFDERALYHANGISGKIVVEKLLRQIPPRSWHAKMAAWFRSSVVSVLKKYKNPDHRAVVRASFLDEKAYLAPEIKAAFRASGLYHLLALSGLHAGILLTAVYLLLSLVPVPATARHGCALAVLWLYYLYIGPVPSLARATVMSTVVIASLMFQRKNYPLQSLGSAALIWLFFSPASLFQAGFQLSFLATFGIVALHPFVMKAYPGHAHPVVDYVLRLLLTPFSVSCSAFCATLPAVLWHFGTVSLYGFVANIVGATLMTGVMWLFFAALITAPAAGMISQAAVYGSSLFLDGLMAVAGWAMKIPGSSIKWYAPYPELIGIYFLLMTAVISVAAVRRKQLLMWGLPLLCCLIPADYLVRRAAAGVHVIRFATGRKGVEVTAVRRPEGTAWLYCSGSDAAVERVIQFSVLPWMRHVPGTVIKKIYLMESGKKKGTAVGTFPRESITGMQTRIFSAGRWHTLPCTTVYSGTAGRAPPVFRIFCGTASLFSKGPTITASYGRPDDRKFETAEIPVRAAFKKRRFRFTSFK